MLVKKKGKKIISLHVYNKIMHMSTYLIKLILAEPQLK